MNPVLQLFAPSFMMIFVIFLSAELVTSEDCGQEELSQCARPLQVLSSTAELSFVTKKSELEQLCPDLHAGLRCIHSYTRRCMSQKQRAHFNQLYHGTNTVINELCEDGPYQEEFLRHAPCMHSVQRDYERCANRYQATMSQLGKPKNQTDVEKSTEVYDGRRRGKLVNGDQVESNAGMENFGGNPTVSEKMRDVNDGGYEEYQEIMRRQHLLRQKQLEEQRRRQLMLQGQIPVQDEEEAEEQLRTVCCSFQEYMRCSQNAVRCQCGEEAAKFTKRFLDKMANSLIKLHCANYGEGSGRCVGFSSSDSILNHSRYCATILSVISFVALTLYS